MKNLAAIDNNLDITTKEYVDAAIPIINLNGSTTTSPSFYAPTSAGTSGQVLTSRGSGAPTWQNIGFSDVTSNSATITLAGTGYSFSRVDEKLRVYTLNSTTQASYNLVLSNNSSSAETKYVTNGLQITRNDGSTTVEGSAILNIGTNVAKGTAGNQTGKIRLYGDTAYRIELKAGSPTSNRPITFPDKSGTIALTSDIPTILVTDVTVNGTSVVVSGVAALAGPVEIVRW